MPYAQKSLDKRKITRKKADLQLKFQGYYPAEGHAAISQLKDSSLRVVILGGARRREEGTWSMGNVPMEMLFEVSPDDVFLKSINKLPVKYGGQLKSLSGSAIIGNCDSMLMFGGIEFDLDTMNLCHSKE